MSRKLRLVTVNSVKHVVDHEGTFTAANITVDIAEAVNAPSNTVTTDCHHGSTIKAIWLSLDFCGLAASGVLQTSSVYIMKDPGDNLTPPGALAVGSSNEKKFIFKQWISMTMRNQEGNPPYHWEGWIKVPKRYQRMGTDDIISLTWGNSAGLGHISWQAIYKEYF